MTGALGPFGYVGDRCPPPVPEPFLSHQPSGRRASASRRSSRIPSTSLSATRNCFSAPWGSTILVVDSRDPTPLARHDLRAFIPPGAEVTARTPFRRTPAPSWKRGTRSRKPPRSHREGARRSRGAKLRQRESRARGGPAGRRGGA